MAAGPEPAQGGLRANTVRLSPQADAVCVGVSQVEVSAAQATSAVGGGRGRQAFTPPHPHLPHTPARRVTAAPATGTGFGAVSTDQTTARQLPTHADAHAAPVPIPRPT